MSNSAVPDPTYRDGVGSDSAFSAVAKTTLGLRPFTSFFEQLANQRYQGSLAGRVQRMCEEYPRLYLSCVMLDIAVVKAPIALTLVFATGLSAYRLATS